MLRPADFDKSGRIKNVVDLVMAAECALKAHCFGGRSTTSAIDLYRAVRKASHDLHELAKIADFCTTRTPICAWQTDSRISGSSNAIARRLGNVLPFGIRRAGLKRYQATVANNAWIVETSNQIKHLIQNIAGSLTVVYHNVSVALARQHDEEMAAFMVAIRRR